MHWFQLNDGHLPLLLLVRINSFQTSRVSILLLNYSIYQIDYNRDCILSNTFSLLCHLFHRNYDIHDILILDFFLSTERSTLPEPLHLEVSFVSTQSLSSLENTVSKIKILPTIARLILHVARRLTNLSKI
jgi:hypothetical protein